MDEAELIFPLIPSRRLVGSAFGGFPSARRGTGSDVAGMRPYAPGDDVKLIDWNASAKLSSARGTDVFLVHEHFADESPEVLVVLDRRPSMAIYRPPLPWLDKGATMRTAARAVAASGRAARGLVGTLAAGEPGSDLPQWVSPRSRSGPLLAEDDWEESTTFHAEEDSLVDVLDYLAALRSALPPGSFVFVLSDFLAPPPVATWLSLLERSWDVVPVVIQDPTWESSFPELPAITLPIARPDGSAPGLARIGAAEARRRQHANEQRRAELEEELESLGLDPVVIGDAAPEAVLRAFVDWADERLLSRGGGW